VVTRGYFIFALICRRWIWLSHRQVLLTMHVQGFSRHSAVKVKATMTQSLTGECSRCMQLECPKSRNIAPKHLLPLLHFFAVCCSESRRACYSPCFTSGSLPHAMLLASKALPYPVFLCDSLVIVHPNEFTRTSSSCTPVAGHYIAMPRRWVAMEEVHPREYLRAARRVQTASSWGLNSTGRSKTAAAAQATDMPSTVAAGHWGK
jgi:hypothetical protein